MNTETDIEYEEELKSEARAAKFALECRAIRMYLVTHPGSTTFEMKADGVKGRRDQALSKMLGMGIVRCEPGPDGHKAFRWTVVPQ